MANSFNPTDLINHAKTAARLYSIKPPPNLARGPAGLHPGNESGTSIDFYDYRSYQPGDDLRRVDWRVFARSDLLVIRQFQVEISPLVEILLDTSASMGLYPGKAAAASYTAAFLASAVRNARGRPVLFYHGSRFPGSDFEHGLAGARFDSEADLADQPVPPAGAGRPLRVIISDFLFSQGIETFFNAATRNTSILIAIQILCETEQNPHLHGGFRFIDAENHSWRKNLRVDRNAVIRYKKRLAAHLESLQETWQKLRAISVRTTVSDTFPGSKSIHRRIVPSLLAREIINVS